MFACYEDYETFISGRISKLRSQKKVSARDMSLSIGQGAGYISNIENKNNMPSMQGLYFICEYFQITPNDFFGEEIENPMLLNEIIKKIKPLNDKTLEAMRVFLEELSKK